MVEVLTEHTQIVDQKGDPLDGKVFVSPNFIAEIDLPNTDAGIVARQQSEYTITNGKLDNPIVLHPTYEVEGEGGEFFYWFTVSPENAIDWTFKVIVFGGTGAADSIEWTELEKLTEQTALVQECQYDYGILQDSELEAV